MKTSKKSSHHSELKNRPEQLGENTKATGVSTASVAAQRSGEAIVRTDPGADRPHIDFARREANRGLAVESLLNLLRSQAPRFFELAQVVGKWVWIQFDGKQPPEITSQLAELGFHWNNKRQVWQHPCGPVTVEASPADPREKYGCHHPADMQAA